MDTATTTETPEFTSVFANTKPLGKGENRPRDAATELVKLIKWRFPKLTDADFAGLYPHFEAYAYRHELDPDELWNWSVEAWFDMGDPAAKPFFVAAKRVREDAWRVAMPPMLAHSGIATDLATLAHHLSAAAPDGVIWLPCRMLAQFTGKSKSTIAATLRNMRRAGILQLTRPWGWEEKKRQAAEYRFTWGTETGELDTIEYITHNPPPPTQAPAPEEPATDPEPVPAPEERGGNDAALGGDRTGTVDKAADLTDAALKKLHRLTEAPPQEVTLEADPAPAPVTSGEALKAALRIAWKAGHRDIDTLAAVFAEHTTQTLAYWRASLEGITNGTTITPDVVGYNGVTYTNAHLGNFKRLVNDTAAALDAQVQRAEAEKPPGIEAETAADLAAAIAEKDNDAGRAPDIEGFIGSDLELARSAWGRVLKYRNVETYIGAFKSALKERRRQPAGVAA